MKCMVVVFATLAVASAQLNPFGAARRPSALPAPAPSPYRPAPVPVARVSADSAANIVRYESDISPDGSYTYAYETDNGIAAQAQGTPRDFGGNPPVVPDVVQGSFSYTSPEGVPVAISYIADENGFQPQGDVLPTPPPIPPQIARALDYILRAQRQ